MGNVNIPFTLQGLIGALQSVSVNASVRSPCSALCLL
jgi:hypothetical protein